MLLHQEPIVFDVVYRPDFLPPENFWRHFYKPLYPEIPGIYYKKMYTHTMKFSEKIILGLGDLISLIGAFFIFLITTFPLDSFTYEYHRHASPMVVIGILWIIVFFVFNFYEIENQKPDLVFLKKLGIASSIILILGVVFFYINPLTSLTPKINLIIFQGISLVLIIIWRKIFFNITYHLHKIRLVIICNDEAHQALLHELKNREHLGFIHCGTFTTCEAFLESQTDADIAMVHNIQSADYPSLEKLLASKIHVMNLAESYEQLLYKIPVHTITNEWIIHSISKTTNIAYRYISRIISILFAITVIITTLPIAIITALCIWCHDKGPIFYSHARTGLHGKPFRLYKFRSMIVESETSGPAWTQTNDSRITPVGKIIRKLHIDELPQMYSLLTGDLALVGPRPERPEFVEQLEREIPYYFMRHTIKPGFTGWAQIKFRYARSIQDSQEKFEYDLYYLKNRHLFLDLGIILKTVQIIFTH